MRIVSLLICMLVVTSGCVKFHILPEDTVKKTFEASKELVNESKLKRQGGKRREYAKQIVVSDYGSQKIAEDTCMQELVAKTQEDSPSQPPVIMATKTSLVPNLSIQAIECSLVAYVWP